MMSPGPVSAKDSLPIDDDLDDVDDFDITGPEFRSLNAAMDQLQLALDRLESRNAGIHEELLELLQSNREIRQSLNQENQSQPPPTVVDGNRIVDTHLENGQDQEKSSKSEPDTVVYSEETYTRRIESPTSTLVNDSETELENLSLEDRNNTEG